jgi:hypothetical protein
MRTAFRPGPTVYRRVIAPDPLTRLRAICLAFPEVTERPSHSAPTWFVRDKSSFVTLWADGHHDNEFPHLWCAAQPGAQEELIETEPRRFFRPPYVGHRGWLAVRLDRRVAWTEIDAICRDAYRVIAPKTLVAQLDAR